MRIFRIVFGVFMVLLWAQSLPAVENNNDREYLPGDVVHVVVEAPLDTAKIVAVMPDGEDVTLNLNKKTNIWHGYWEVPFGFKKGTYDAKLVATDIENNSWEGKTAVFYVGEPSLNIMVRFLPPKEAKPAAVAPPPPPIIAPAPLPPRKKVAQRTPPVLREDKTSYKLHLIIAARNYMLKQRYEDAKRQLRDLLKIEPNNAEVKVMLSRIEALIKMKKEGK